MTPDECRESYLRFFEERGHTRHPSDSLVPDNDPTLLFTGAGMNQFKAMFLGKGNLPFQRATTTQKCIRMPDLENVGRTSSHHTFFEMLGNFSLGDYFKQEAIAWAWELLGQWGVPGDRLSVTVYEDDDEAAAIWTDEAGVPANRVFRDDEAENFWPASAPSKGPNGLCGPCSEIYFDFHPEQGDYPQGGPAVDGKRFVEIWNLVFTQFDRRDGGELVPALPQRNIDTGMGFERIVRVLESVERGQVLPSNFETRLFAPILETIHEHIGRATTFGTPEGARTRRIADHVRAAVFCIADGVQPSNEKQGYVVRKVLRRAMLERHVLGGDVRQPWLANLAETIIDTMQSAWPLLSEARALVTGAIATEEEKFAGAFLSGSQKLRVLAADARSGGLARLPGDKAFLLYDTFGLPLDMQRQLLEAEAMDVDEDGYREAMAEQRRRSREGSKIAATIFDEGPLASVSGKLPETAFLRGDLEQAVEILAIVDDDSGTQDDDVSEDRQVVVVLDKTPFYAEGGGQVGDVGVIEGEGFRIEVDDVVSLRGISLHRGAVVGGDPGPGPATARVDQAARAATARNHTATHLLHAALRRVLGDDVTQAGSLVSPERLRFDFRFGRGLTAEEIGAVEDLVNRWILANEDVSSDEMGQDEARKAGAMALFGEKYGDVVRVVRVANRTGEGDSVELCGGTHVQRSGDIGLLRVTTEGSIASGIRRIEARTGLGILELMRTETGLLQRSAALFKTSPDSLEERIAATQGELKETRRELDDVRSAMAEERLAGAIREQHGLKILAATLQGVPVKKLREIAGEYAKSRCDLVLLAVPDDASTNYLAAAGKGAQAAGLAARDLIEALARRLNGKGGGNAAFAQGRGGPSEDLQTVLEAAIDDCAAASS